MAKSRREKLREATVEEIKATARKLMSESGTAGISIRAIARQMGMTAPAIYYYFANLDDLITALIVDAFEDLADFVEAAANGGTGDRSYRDRLTDVSEAYRNWALAHPIDFQLIYGNPVPGYEQPFDVTYPPARRSFALHARLYAAAIETGELEPAPEYTKLPPELKDPLDILAAHEEHDLPHTALYLAASGWAQAHGLVMLELFNLIQPVVGDTGAFYRNEVAVKLKQIGFKKLRKGATS